MSRLAARGEYPTITATDEALMLEAPKGRRTAKPRVEGIAAAVEMLGQIGIRWSPAPGV